MPDSAQQSKRRDSKGIQQPVNVHSIIPPKIPARVGARNRFTSLNSFSGDWPQVDSKLDRKSTVIPADVRKSWNFVVIESQVALFLAVSALVREIPSPSRTRSGFCPTCDSATHPPQRGLNKSVQARPWVGWELKSEALKGRNKRASGGNCYALSGLFAIIELQSQALPWAGPFGAALGWSLRGERLTVELGNNSFWCGCICNSSY
jgi:hypothetical protein